MPFPRSVTVRECWARDGLQPVPDVVPTVAKLEMIHPAKVRQPAG